LAPRRGPSRRGEPATSPSFGLCRSRRG
jgi:hypothetical protein